MSKEAVAVRRTNFLRGLGRRRFDRYRFVGADAVVVRLPGAAPIPPVVQAALEGAGDQRWYSEGDGHLVKWKHGGEAIPLGSWLEVGGWDHEHCDACHRVIRVGVTAWLTARAPWVQLCPYCYRRVNQLRPA